MNSSGQLSAVVADVVPGLPRSARSPSALEPRDSNVLRPEVIKGNGAAPRAVRPRGVSHVDPGHSRFGDARAVVKLIRSRRVLQIEKLCSSYHAGHDFSLGARRPALGVAERQLRRAASIGEMPILVVPIIVSNILASFLRPNELIGASPPLLRRGLRRQCLDHRRNEQSLRPRFQRSRACRLHPKSCCGDKPCRRATAQTNSPIVTISATIRVYAAVDLAAKCVASNITLSMGAGSANKNPCPNLMLSERTRLRWSSVSMPSAITVRFSE